MKLLDKIWRSNFLIKLRSWEYWPFHVLYAPIIVYWVWLSLRARSLFYFTASNPAIENGGMMGESKHKILNLLPDQYKPRHLLFSPAHDLAFVLEEMSRHGLSFPIICKPDVGERGWMVQKINDAEALENYLGKIGIDFIVQEYVDLPLELGVFYYKYPNQPSGKVSSIVLKEMLSVNGDGQSTLKTLILANDRAKLQWVTLREKYTSVLDSVLANGEHKQLISIGNHCKGAKFLDANYLINNSLHDVFDCISRQIDGFYFGRYDIRVKSIKDLYTGKIMVMELNGAGAEPSHIYQPGYSLWKAYKAIFHHWKVLFDISIINHKKGVKYLSLVSGWNEYKKARTINK